MKTSTPRFIVLMIIAITMIGCSGETYNDNPRHSNVYFIFEKSSMDSIYQLIPNDPGKTLYTDKGNLNWKQFDKVENTMVEIEDGVIYFYGDADFLYFDGDQSGNQDWIHDGQIHYLKINHPVVPDPDHDFFTLSTSIRNW